jgi:hypothetical protein
MSKHVKPCITSRVLKIAYSYAKGAVLSRNDEKILSYFDMVEIYNMAKRHKEQTKLPL